MKEDICKVCGKPKKGKKEDNLCVCPTNVSIAETVTINEKFGVSADAKILIE
jgi:hypothetical protein